MTSFFRKSTTLLAMGGAILGTWIATGFSALALSQAEIVQELGNVPVFTIVNEEGYPLLRAIDGEGIDENETPSAFTEVFISHEDAETVLDAFRERNPEVGNAAQVAPVPLSRIYEAAALGRGEESRLEFLFVPIVDEVTYAMSILPEEQQESSGVPLFMVSFREDASETDEASNEAEDDEENVTFLTRRNGDEEAIALFFTRDQFDTAVASIEESDPDAADNLHVDVIWLEDYINFLEQSEEDDDSQQYEIIPLDESLDFQRNFQPNVSAQ